MDVPSALHGAGIVHRFDAREYHRDAKDERSLPIIDEIGPGANRVEPRDTGVGSVPYRASLLQMDESRLILTSWLRPSDRSNVAR